MPRSPQPRDTRAEIATRADFSGIRYAQCWEDADVLLEALDVQPGERCLSVASGGENTLSLLARAPAAVVAVDLSAAQLALLELKAAAIGALDYDDALALVGLRPSDSRMSLYQRLRGRLRPAAAAYWDGQREAIAAGVCNIGRFERYLALFGRVVLRLAHSRGTIDALFVPRDAAARRTFYDERWDNLRWRALVRLFFSRTVLGLGRDPSFFRYVEEDVPASIRARIERALTALDPAANPYLHWIVYRRYADALPHAWRRSSFEAIRRNLGALELRHASIETALAEAPAASVDRFNLSDIFEYVSEASSAGMFHDIARCGRPGGRVAYWNMMVPRRRPDAVAGRLVPLEAESRRLHACAATFFYGAFRVDALADGRR